MADAYDRFPDAVENEDFYIVKPGDTLEEIAERFLGKKNLWPVLAQINDLASCHAYPGTMLLLHPEGLEPEFFGKTKKERK